MRRLAAILLLVAIVLVGCSNGPRFSPDKIDVGMTAKNVQEIIGNPDSPSMMQWNYFETIEGQT